MAIRKLDKQEHRIETGPTKFGDDWSGVFLRGDYAVPMAFSLREVLDKGGADYDPILKQMLLGLCSTLASCDERYHKP